ncbi:carboxypeptidase-like regulatory domain-containing protein [Edaphobacter acidisoli]|nr:hypothetical protein [Edaphobacter acidisoli]
MKFWLRCCGLMLALSPFGPPLRGQMDGIGYAQSSTGTNAAPVNVTGTVVNANTGSPIARVLVQLGGRAILTDHEGKFEFDQFSETNAMLRVTKPGYYFSLEPRNDGSHMLSSADLSAPLTLRLYPEALLTGTVTAPDGTPLSGVSINAMRIVFDAGGHRWEPISQMSRTNGRGEFRIPVPAGEYKLRTFYAMNQPEQGDIVIPLIFPQTASSTTSNLIKLGSGEEQHVDLHPFVGTAHAVWLSAESSTQGIPSIQVHTANGGAFQVGAQSESVGGDLFKLELPDGSYTLSATKYSPDGVQFAETNVTVAGHDVSGAVLRFQPVPTVPLEIQVNSATSDNASATVPPNPYLLGLILQSESEDMTAGMIGPTQKDGSFGFRASPGTYRLVARNTGSPWYVESATYGDRDLLRQDIEIAPGGGGQPIELMVSNQTGTLSGRVSVNGAAGRSWIYLIPTTPSLIPVVRLMSYADNRVSIGGMSSDLSGSYTARLAPGSYQVVAFSQMHEADFSNPDTLAPYASHVRTVTIHAGDKATLDLDAVTDEEIKP